jgi:sugar/nucleoside kinase (ribokinase family)
MTLGPHPKVHGIGEVVLDHIWDTGRGSHDGRLYESRGGGSVFNVLATLAQLGWAAKAHAVVGDDPAGELARADLGLLGVDVTGVRATPRRRTRLIFELLGVENATQVGGSSHSFTTKCPVCTQRIPDARRPPVRLDEPDLMPGSWAVYDQLTSQRMAHATVARSQGAYTVLDLGAVSYLRYLPTAKILAHMRTFDLIFLNGKVAASLARRVDGTELDLANYLPQSVLVITQGKHGALVTAAGGFRERVPAPHVPILVDDSGAGDALCAHTLFNLQRIISAKDPAQGMLEPMDPLETHRPRLDPSFVAAAAASAEDEVADALRYVGARGHLPKPPAEDHYERLRGSGLRELQAQSWRAQRCVLCDLAIDSEDPPAILAQVPERFEVLGATGGSQSTTDSVKSRALPLAAAIGSTQAKAGSKPGARRNTSLLLNRMLAAGEHPDAVRIARDILLAPGASIQVVGSGGSLPAAVYIADVLNSHGHFAMATTPGDVLDSVAAAEILILVSYSGSTRDLAAVAVEAKKRAVRQIVLLTGSRSPALASELRPLHPDVVLSYASPPRGAPSGGVRERGFVSIAGTVAPCVPWLVAADGLSSVIDMVGRLAGSRSHVAGTATALSGAAALSGRLHVVYGPGGLPAALDVESKFTESGLPAVTLHEQKDLSHGRFMTVLQPVYGSADVLAPVLFVAAGPATRYQSALERSFDQAHVPHRFLRSEAGGITGSLELLTLAQWFSQQFGSELGTDISRPAQIPSAGLRLYKWRGPLP